jgi:hypothetical protein
MTKKGKIAPLAFNLILQRFILNGRVVLFWVLTTQYGQSNDTIHLMHVARGVIKNYKSG